MVIFVDAFYQTGLETRSKARRPIKVEIKRGRGRSGTSRDSNPAGARGVMVIVTGYGHGDTSSIPGQD